MNMLNRIINRIAGRFYSVTYRSCKKDFVLISHPETLPKSPICHVFAYKTYAIFTAFGRSSTLFGKYGLSKEVAEKDFDQRYTPFSLAKLAWQYYRNAPPSKYRGPLVLA